MLEYLDTSRLNKKFLVYNGWVSQNDSKLAFHGERPVVLDGEEYEYRTDNKTKKLRRNQTVASAWRPKGAYHQVLPRHQGVSYVITRNYQVAQVSGNQEHVLPQMECAVKIGQSRTGLYVLDANGVVTYWKKDKKKWTEAEAWRPRLSFANISADFAVSWNDQRLFRDLMGVRLQKEGEYYKVEEHYEYSSYDQGSRPSFWSYRSWYDRYTTPIASSDFASLYPTVIRTYNHSFDGGVTQEGRQLTARAKRVIKDFINVEYGFGGQPVVSGGLANESRREHTTPKPKKSRYVPPSPKPPRHQVTRYRAPHLKRFQR